MSTTVCYPKGTAFPINVNPSMANNNNNSMASTYNAEGSIVSNDSTANINNTRIPW